MLRIHAIASLVLFVLLAIAMRLGHLDELDKTIVALLRYALSELQPALGKWEMQLVRDFSAIGSFTALATLTIAVFASLFASGRRFWAWYLLAMVALAYGIGSLLPHLFDRPRPEGGPADIMVTTFSFPSTHTLRATVVYLTLSAIFWVESQNYFLRKFFLFFALGLVLLIGLTRVYLGVHYFSDVLAGWLAGGCLSAICHSLVSSYRSRRHGPGASHS